MTTQPAMKVSAFDRKQAMLAASKAVGGAEDPPDKNASKPEYHEFSQTVLKAMLKKKMSQSDLAKAIWGKDANGYARNRDRITAYIKGRGYPEPDNLAQLAKALDLPLAALQIDRPAKGVTRVNSSAMDVQLHFLSTEPGKCLLIVNKVISTNLALEIAKRIKDEEGDDAA